MKRSHLSFVMILGLAACSRQAEFLYKAQEVPQNRKIEMLHKVASLEGFDQLDIIWDIDNSGSMEDKQADVINNTGVFMQNFIKTPTIKWKIGLISTSVGEDPYIGFDPANQLNESTPDPETAFQNAVRREGTNGDSTEKFFDPVVKALTHYPNFVRQNALLALIIVSDEDEQSSQYDEASFLKYITALKGGNVKQIATYFVLLTSTNGCTPNEQYDASSPYTKLAKDTNGKIYNIHCPKFGDLLADLGKDIFQKTTSPRLPLRERPIPSTIRVYSDGQLVKGGPKDQGGFWIYDYDSNSLVFQDLSFVHTDNAEVKVEFEADDGWPV